MERRVLNGCTCLAKVQNEAISIVKAVPGHKDLSCPHCSSASNLEDSLNCPTSRGHMSKS